jgi:hypothetical protein
MTGSFPSADHPSCLASVCQDILNNNPFLVTAYWDRTLIAPNFLGRIKAKSFTADALRLMRIEEQHAVTGDLIFACPSNWSGLAETVGFLGIDKPWDVEALVRKTLFSTARRESELAASPAAKAAPAAAIRKCYWLSPWIRLFQYVSLAAGALAAVCVIADVVLAIFVLVCLVIGPERLFGPPAPGIKNFSGTEIAATAAAGVGSLLMAVVVVGMFFHFALRIPIEITINEDRDVSFRGRLRTVTIPVSDIVMIRTGEWFDPNRFQAIVRHKGGKLTLINHFSDFADFLATVKELNPSIEIKGF